MARNANSQGLNKVNDPTLGTLRQFAKAISVDVKELL